MSTPIPATQPAPYRIRVGDPVTSQALTTATQADRFSFATGRRAVLGAVPSWVPGGAPETLYEGRIRSSPQGPGRFVITLYGQDADIDVDIGGVVTTISLPVGGTSQVSGTVTAPTVDAWYDLTVSASAITGIGPQLIAIVIAEDLLTSGELP